MLSSLRTGLSTRAVNAARTASIATRSFSTPTDNLLESLSEEDRLVYGEPVQIPTTHNITVAHLHLRSYLPDRLDFFADFARRTAAALEMPCSGVIPLPVKTSKWTVNKSPFVHKKAQETFERKTHKRLLAIKDTHPDVVRRWVQFLSQNSMAGVGMKITTWENEELGIGQKRLEKAKKGESRNRSVAESMKEASIDLKEGEQPKEQAYSAPTDQEVPQDEPSSSSSSSVETETATATAESVKANENSGQQYPAEPKIAKAVEPRVDSGLIKDPELAKTIEKTLADINKKVDQQ
ncbi:mitochondrial 37S ribosomal protein rsm10 [Lobosporangium transversale]|uniref:Small ribosomal subunit protein uS10m n=1 Tax=Lobosporangium transversale TaxID=64571 RepID=A0A1Y2GS51_9FUNG|nr:ribosomal protein S10 domain-containing protein [Lobosporangium transversale]KAF9898914.1 mitochondrial 37S ribosomal protein rsm10 [Lobosporangium transversale]ORZ20946.1 ribosomal protein S10 domain-containing protein [Lobosporangium transversale]|eukprot:XP_021882855.1 ribosomal protein S10 domain-containing protein [Lobosporangium transversale]